jgi:hypothetical protein
MKKTFDITEFGAFTFEVNGESISYSDCEVLAERKSFNRQVIDSVLKISDEKFVHIMVGAESPEYSQNGITKGYYLAERIDEESAKDLAAITNAFTAKRV